MYPTRAHRVRVISETFNQKMYFKVSRRRHRQHAKLPLTIHPTPRRYGFLSFASFEPASSSSGETNAPMVTLNLFFNSCFNPVRPGEFYADGRYKVIRKLGYGGYSTVWLSEEIAYCCLLNSFADWKQWSGYGTRIHSKIIRD